MPPAQASQQQQQVDQHAQLNAVIAALAVAELASAWPRVDWSSADAIGAVQVIYRAVTTKYGAAAASVAAQAYDEARPAGLPKFQAVVADPVPKVVTDKAVESAFHSGNPAVTPADVAATAPEPNPSPTTSDLPIEERVPARLNDSVSRHVLQPGRDTTVLSVLKDPGKPRGWARVTTNDKACAFCVLMASRIHLYKSAKTGGFDLRNIKAAQYHKHCTCIAVPVFGDELPAGQKDHNDMYQKAAADAGTSANAKKVLASMRKLYGLK
jgi:hypothetical protein